MGLLGVGDPPALHSFPHRDVPCPTTSFSQTYKPVRSVCPQSCHPTSAISALPPPPPSLRADRLASPWTAAVPSPWLPLPLVPPQSSPHAARQRDRSPLRWVLVAILQKSKLRHVKPQNCVSQVMQPPPSADRAEGVRTQHVTQAPHPSQRPLAVAPRAESILPACEAPARP